MSTSLISLACASPDRRQKESDSSPLMFAAFEIGHVVGRCGGEEGGSAAKGLKMSDVLFRGVLNFGYCLCRQGMLSAFSDMTLAGLIRRAFLGFYIKSVLMQKGVCGHSHFL